MSLLFLEPYTSDWQDFRGVFSGLPPPPPYTHTQILDVFKTTIFRTLYLVKQLFPDRICIAKIFIALWFMTY